MVIQGSTENVFCVWSTEGKNVINIKEISGLMYYSTTKFENDAKYIISEISPVPM